MRKIKFTAKLFLLPSLIIIFNFLEYGLVWDQFYKILYPLMLAVMVMVNIQVPKLRRLSLILSYGMLILMVLLYLMGQLDLSNIIGSSGLAILIITLLTYLPQLIRKGYLENF